MADIAPFRGITYVPGKVTLDKVVTPPYDVIDAAERARLAADPHNFVHLDLPEAATPDGDKYAAAAATLEAWLADGTLQRDGSRAIYRYNQTFTSKELGGRTVTRKGFIAALRLTPFSDGEVKPHERTLRGPKEDRLRLMQATRTQMSQVFATYRDPSGEVDRMLKRVEAAPPTLDATTADGTQHRVWRCTDGEIIGAVRRLMASRKLYILDGHHRYETMLGWRDQLATGRDLPMYSAANYGTAFMVAMDDPGLVILPTHRVVHSVAGFERAKFLEAARAYFRIDVVAGASRDAAKVRTALAEVIGHQPSVAAVFPGDPDVHILSLDPHIDPLAHGMTGHPVVVRLDVSLLHGLLLERVLGITSAAQEAQTNLRYVKDTGATLAAIAAGEGQVGFLMNPPTLEQVKQVADLGEVMPQKSTYFYPKLASGLVLAPIDVEDELL